MKFLTANAPAFSLTDVQAVTSLHFGLHGKLTPLYSERDQNSLLCEADGAAWVVKIANAAEDPANISAQIAALAHIATVDPALPVPRLRRTVQGDGMVQVAGHWIYVLSYLPGDLATASPRTASSLRLIGGTLARLGRALRGFFDPTTGGRGLLWDMRLVQGLAPALDALPAAEQGRMAALLAAFQADVIPRLASLRAQVIHGDLHEQNLILRPDGAIAGIIDFGDMIHAPLIFDLTGSASDLLTDPARIEPVLRHLVAGYHAVTPLEEAEVDLLYDLVLMRLVATRLISAWRQAETPDAPNYMVGSGFGSLEVIDALEGLGRHKATDLVRAACGMIPLPKPLDDLGDLVERRRKLMGSHLYLFYDPPLHMVRGDGVWLIDQAGRPFLDCYNNVPIVGHCRPEVTEAIARQSRILNTNTRYLGEQILDYGERLTGMLGGGLTVCAFVNSGSEANDIAWRMARAFTGAAGGLVQEFGYHGITEVSDAFSPSANKHGAIAPHIRTLLAPDGYRGIYPDGPGMGERYAADADVAIASLAKAGLKPAAYICDSAFMTNGVLQPCPGYLSGVFDRVRAAGGLCLADEVQAGFGRMGSHFWGFQHHGVTPDIVTIGKPAGNGHPIGIVITRPEIYEAFIRDTAFFSTFGGNNVSCAAGMAVLDVIETEGLVQNATDVGACFKAGLQALMHQHDLIGCVRGTGLALSIELVTDRAAKTAASAETKRLMNLMRDQGVLTGNEGPHGNIIKIRPPIVFSRAHVDIAVQAFDAALALI